MLIPKSFLDSVVAIELPSNDGEFSCIATGFLCGFPLCKKNDKGEDLFKLFLLTNRHVFRNKKSVFLRFNTKESSERYFLPLVNEKGEETWSTHPHPSVDLGIVPVNASQLSKDNIDFKFIPEQNMAFSDVIRDVGIAQGDNIFVLGYPMGLVGNIKNYAILRGGIIARIDDEIIEKEHGFLIDASVFPGNSGGPVFLKPEVVSIVGTKAVQKAYLLGVVKSYIPYTERAYSLQSDPPQPRIEFMENSGLAFVIPMDFVRDVIRVLMPKKEEEKAEQKDEEMATQNKAI